MIICSSRKSTSKFSKQIRKLKSFFQANGSFFPNPSRTLVREIGSFPLRKGRRLQKKKNMKPPPSSPCVLSTSNTFHQLLRNMVQDIANRKDNQMGNAGGGKKSWVMQSCHSLPAVDSTCQYVGDAIQH